MTTAKNLARRTSFDPGVRRFDLARHVAELVANDGVVAKEDAKGLALACVLLKVDDGISEGRRGRRRTH